jgi:hypothetical protein
MYPRQLQLSFKKRPQEGNRRQLCPPHLFSPSLIEQPRLLNQLMDERKPFHEKILPDKTGEQPTLVAPPPVAPQPKPLRSVLVR